MHYIVPLGMPLNRLQPFVVHALAIIVGFIVVVAFLLLLHAPTMGTMATKGQLVS